MRAPARGAARRARRAAHRALPLRDRDRRSRRVRVRRRGRGGGHDRPVAARCRRLRLRSALLLSPARPDLRRAERRGEVRRQPPRARRRPRPEYPHRVMIHRVVLVAVMMLTCSCAPAVRTAVAASHPLEPLSATEIQRAFALVRAHFAAGSLPTDALLFPQVVLNEPPKAFVRSWRARQSFPRAASGQVLHYPTN